MSLNKTLGQNGWEVEGINEPGARFKLDANGNVKALLGPDGSTHATLGTKVITVGAGGRFGTLSDAVAYINTQTYQETLHTGSYTSVEGASILTASASISSSVAGRQLFLKHASDSFLYPIEVTNPGISAEFKPFYPMYGRGAGATDFSIVSPTAYWLIQLLPGRHEGTGTKVIIPPFVHVAGFGRNVTYYEDEAQAANAGCIEIPAYSQGVSLSNFSIQVSGSNRGSCILLSDSTTDVFTTGQTVVLTGMGIHSTGASEDGIWKISTSKNVIDSVKIRDLLSTGYYDSILIANAVRAEVSGSEIVALNSDQDLPQCVSLSGNSLVNSDIRVQNNLLRALNDSTALSASCIGVKVSATTAGTKNTYVKLTGNQIQCNGALNTPDIPSLESTTNGVAVLESGVAVGDLVVHSSNNIFDCSGARLNRALYAGASGKVYTCNDRNKDGTAITTGTASGGTVTVVL